METILAIGFIIILGILCTINIVAAIGQYGKMKYLLGKMDGSTEAFNSFQELLSKTKVKIDG